MPHGGKRSGSGRPAGKRWQPETSKHRANAMARMSAIVEAANDPLSVVAAMVVDSNLDIPTRLSAAHICLPFLYPKLSASQIDARHTVTKVDATALLQRIDERLARMGQTPLPSPGPTIDDTMARVTIEAVPADDAEDE
jgi:hypothetical protein